MSDPQIILIGMQDRIPSDRKLIDVSYKGTEKWKLLSPAIPSHVWCYGSLSAVCMQNAWMYSLVFKEHDNGGVPSPEWYDYRDKGFRRKTAVFNLKLAEAGKKPLYVYWNNTRFGLREARKHIYIPLYHRSIKNSQAMKELRKLYRDGHRLAIRDFNHYPIGDKTFDEILRDLNSPFGHVLVLWNDLINDGAI